MDEQTETRLQLRRDFADFLDHDLGQSKYVKQLDQKIADSVKTRCDVRVEVDVQDVRDFSAALHKRLMEEPTECIPPLEDALDELARARPSDDGGKTRLLPSQAVRVALVGELGAAHLTPRELLATNLNKLVEVYGIVTKVSIVRPKLQKSVHVNEATGQYMQREFRDITSNEGLPTGTAYPTKDSETGHVLTTMFGCCEFINHQTVIIQELPETAPAGQMPRSTEIILENDLVNGCKPGDRISAVGIYKAVAGKVGGVVSGAFRALVVANSVTKLAREVGAVALPMADVKMLRDYCRETAEAGGSVLDHLAASIAPSIYGYDLIKRALVLLLLGGRERNLENGTHLRGDINCLLIGDPGVAKSQLLRAVMNISPLAVSTTGRGSSGVGLTAAVTSNRDTGEKSLEAGAMVLADRGICCIDEFDKMNDNDRVAVHEVMEQQTVTIAKAGIHTSLHARCSVLAAANPLYGTYDHSMSVTKNINLPDSLLSRFDLLFVVLDNLDAGRDRRIAEHVVNQHLYRVPGDDGRKPLLEHTDYRYELDEAADKAAAAEGGSEMYVKYDRQLYGPKRAGQPDPLSSSFLKKYFWFCKKRYSESSLTPEATEAIAAYYTELRQSASDRALPVTVRTLETVIRLATAHAKCRQSAKVEEEDVDLAREILDYVMRSSSTGGETNEGPIGGHDNAWTRGRRQGPNLPVKRSLRDEPEEGGDAMEDEGPAAMDTDGGAGAAQGEEGENDENAPPSGPLSRAQRATVVAAVKALLLDSESESFLRSLGELQAALRAAGHWYSEAEVEGVLVALSLETDEGREKDVPIAYDAGDKTFYAA